MYEVYVRTNIVVDEEMIVRIRKATGLATKREIVESALRHYAAFLEAEPGPRGSALGDEMRADVRARAAAMPPEARVQEALRLGQEQIRLLARTQGISEVEARRRHEATKATGRRRGR